MDERTKKLNEAATIAVGTGDAQFVVDVANEILTEERAAWIEYARAACAFHYEIVTGANPGSDVALQRLGAAVHALEDLGVDMSEGNIAIYID